MAELASFWVGNALGPIEIASARSFLRQGDKLTIYSYDTIEGLPQGVRLGDAQDVMPANRIIRHRKTGSPALHSDMFRYALMAKTDAIWVDLDIIALRPFIFPSPWVFGYEAPNYVNGAVLRLPKDSTALQALIEFGPETRGIPPMLQGFRRFKYQIRSWLHGGLTPERWPWGAIGPAALTHYLRQSQEIDHALPVSAFYAIPLNEASRFVTPGAILPGDIPDDAWAVHLWGKELRHYMDKHHGGQAPKGSFLADILAMD